MQARNSEWSLLTPDQSLKVSCTLLSQYRLNKPVQANFEYLRRFSVIFWSVRSSFGHVRLIRKVSMTTGCDVSSQKSFTLVSKAMSLFNFKANHTFSVQFGNISGEVVRAMDCILASLVEPKHPRRKPNESDMPTRRSQERYDWVLIVAGFCHKSRHTRLVS